MKLPRDLHVEGVGQVRLHPQNDYIGQGGQAIIYKVSPTLVAKLYFDEAATQTANEPILTPAVMQKGDMVGKLKTLMRLKDDRIIRPQGLVQSTQGQPLGYTMAWVKGIGLPETFTNGFWKDNGWKGKEAVHMAESMRELIAYAHAQGALLVDGNPANYLALQTPKGWQPRALDVDAWQIEKWPATAYHDLTRDPKAGTFSALTDWFGWGTVVCQLLLGVHPYGGRLSGFKPHDILGRMKAGKSIFHQGVALGSGVRDVNLMPKPLLSWMRDTYEGGRRELPPSLYASQAPVTQPALVLRVVSHPATGSLTYTKLLEVTGNPIQRLYPCGVVRLESGTLLSMATKKELGHAHSPKAQVVRQERGWLLADEVNGKLAFSWLTDTAPPQPISNLPVPYGALVQTSTGTSAKADRLFVATAGGLQELKVTTFGTRALLSYGPLWPALSDTTRWYEGCGLQQTLGRMHVLLPYGPSHYTMLDVPELRGLKPLAAKAAFGTVMVVTLNRQGDMQRLELTVTPDGKAYKALITPVTEADLNVTFRPDGSYRAIWEDGTFEARNTRKGEEKLWKDKGIKHTMLLESWANTTVYELEGALWSLSGK